MFFPEDWFATMEPAFVAWVVASLTASGSRGGDAWEVALSKQDGDGKRAPMPKRPGAVIKFLDQVGIEGRQNSHTEDGAVPATDADYHVEAMGRGTVEVQLYSEDDDRVAAANLRASLDLQFPTLDALRAAGITMLEALATERDLSEVFAEENEFRYVLEVPFRVSRRNVTTDYPWIETVAPIVVGVT